MHDHSMPFINQTTESLGIKLYIQFYLFHFDEYISFLFSANAATKNSKTAAKRKVEGERNLLQLQEFLDGFDYQSYLI